MTAALDMSALLAGRKRAHTLPQPFYIDPDFYQLDMHGIYERKWIFAGLECELKEPGDYITLTIARSPVVVLRDNDGNITAFFNTCRHRGSTICQQQRGHVRSLACPYHQWTYNLKGQLTYAGEMQDEFDPSGISLRPVHVRLLEGLIFVCLADEPPDFSEFADALGPRLAPHDLRGAKLVYSEDIVIKANWKLVVENSRECYHCHARHPELSRTFFLRFDADSSDPLVIEHARICREVGLTPGNAIGNDFQLSRMPLTRGALTLSFDGKPLCAKPLGNIEDNRIGSMRWFHFPSMFAHVLPDYAFFFHILPQSAERTLVRSTWFVSSDAEEGKDYDPQKLPELWSVTNAQDGELCERNQEGIASLGYQPGPYSQVRETHVIKFVEWYADNMSDYLNPNQRRPAIAA
jgi:phenylpropionate dioxygenase-like ring-hydroxylating dioxygenase large terminal subunit